VPFGIVDSLELHKPVIPLGSPGPRYPGNSDRPDSQFMLGHAKAKHPDLGARGSSDKERGPGLGVPRYFACCWRDPTLRRARYHSAALPEL
ncbi:hypothetical protein NEUTE2DRAFT_52582, partial [Neurospora tetrasperma FGSC 2509]